jgi:hypothetical protein
VNVAMRAIMVVLILIVLSNNAVGQAWNETSENSVSVVTHRHELILCAGLRTDDADQIQTSPLVALGVLYHFNSYAAVIVDITHAAHSELNSTSHFNSTYVNGGVRFLLASTPIAPYFDMKAGANHYTGEVDGADFADSRLSLGFTVGLTVGLTGRLALELGFSKLIDNFGSRPGYVITSDLPGPHAAVPGYTDYLTYAMYNPAYFSLGLRIGL